MTRIIKVKKRDGSFEIFEPKKIAKVVHAAGLNEIQSHKLSKTVSSWAHNFKKEEITSLEVRNKVLEELRKVNQSAANLFQWYQKTKNHNS